MQYLKKSYLQVYFVLKLFLQQFFVMINKIEKTWEEEFQMSLCFLEKHWLSEVKVRRYSHNIISQYSQENTYAGKYHFLKTFRPATLLKRDSNTDVFLWILQIF